MKSPYNANYFRESIFENDYSAMAELIAKHYKPAKILEIGCGQGQLSKALAKSGAQIIAIDGFSEPDFGDYPNISFYQVDLNDIEKTHQFIDGLEDHFDLTISMEVAEHLDPKVNKHLVDWLTKKTDHVVFSAGVTGQGGEGHINCQDRDFWYRLITEQGFHLNGFLRSEFRENHGIRPWYKLNALDFSRKKSVEDPKLIFDLIKADSYAFSMYFQTQIETERLRAILNIPSIKLVFNVRNWLKRLIGSPPIKL
ncbi:MAG: class I SAM-dependent methyltransferase [Cyclobacteriaceae bacterium]